MPRGKISPRLGGVGFVNRTPLSATVWEMRRLAKRGVAPLGPEVMKRNSGTLRAAFRKYQIVRKGAVTATSRVRVRNLITKRAGKVLQAPESKTRKSKTWRNNLLSALKCTLDKPSWRRAADGSRIADDGSRIPTRDTQLRIEIHHLLLGAHRRNAPPTAQLQDLERALDCTIPFTPSEVEALKLLSDLPNHLRVIPGKWRDPALVDLVQAVGPVWREVTGRSLKHTSVDAAASDKHSLFAKWLGARFKELGLPAPPQKRVTEIVKFLKI